MLSKPMSKERYMLYSHNPSLICPNYKTNYQNSRFQEVILTEHSIEQSNKRLESVTWKENVGVFFTLITGTLGLNLDESCVRTSDSRFWCLRSFLIFMILTMAAWISSLRSSSMCLWVVSCSCFSSVFIGTLIFTLNFLLENTLHKFFSKLSLYITNRFSELQTMRALTHILDGEVVFTFCILCRVRLLLLAELQDLLPR